jgi:hypothetical protein
MAAKYELNFIASAIKPLYEDMAVPFLFFALTSNKGCHVEIVVENPTQFSKKYRKELDYCLELYGSNFIVRSYQNPIATAHSPTAHRFFEVPTIPAKYTYIADIDIMFLEEVLASYLNNWPAGLPYNNILRNPGEIRLTGVHMVETDKYYTSDFITVQKSKYSSVKDPRGEIILGEMCDDVHGLPPFSHRFRPILGIHFSPNRGRDKRMSLICLTKDQKTFLSIRAQHPTLFALPIFDRLYKSLMNDFEFCDCSFHAVPLSLKTPHHMYGSELWNICFLDLHDVKPPAEWTKEQHAKRENERKAKEAEAKEAEAKEAEAKEAKSRKQKEMKVTKEKAREEKEKVRKKKEHKEGERKARELREREAKECMFLKRGF